MSELGGRIHRLLRPRARLRLAGRSLPWTLLLALAMAGEHGIPGALAVTPLVLVFLLPGAVELELERDPERSLRRVILCVTPAAALGALGFVLELIYMETALTGAGVAAATARVAALLQDPAKLATLGAIALVLAWPVSLGVIVRSPGSGAWRLGVAGLGSLAAGGALVGVLRLRGEEAGLVHAGFVALGLFGWGWILAAQAWGTDEIAAKLLRAAPEPRPSAGSEPPPAAQRPATAEPPAAEPPAAGPRRPEEAEPGQEP